MTIAVAIGVAAFLLAMLAAPDAARAWASKEGPLEHVSHVVLAVAVVAAFVRASRPVATRGGRAVVGAIACMLAIVLLEELDWGGAYDLHAIADRIAAIAGRRNLHNAWHGASYIVFAIPVLCVVALGLASPRRDEGWLGPGRDAAFALLAVGVASVAGTLLAESWEAELDEVAELFAYAVLAVAFARGGQPARSSNATKQRRSPSPLA